MDLSPTQALRHIDNVDSDPLPNTDADKVRDVGAIRRLLLHRDTQQWLDRGPTNGGRGPYTSNCGAALGRDNTQKELGRIGGRLAGHVGDNKYVAEITRDGRSKCTYKDCRQPLIKGEYRLGKRPPSVRYGHSPKTRWYHIDCCFKSFGSVTKKSKTITSLDDIERVRHVFPPSEVARIERLIAEHKVRLNAVDAAPPPKKGAVAVGAAAFRMFAASEAYAPSTRLLSSGRRVADESQKRRSHSSRGPRRVCRGREQRRCASSRRRRRSASHKRRRRRSKASRRGRRTRRSTSSPSRRRRPT